MAGIVSGAQYRTAVTAWRTSSESWAHLPLLLAFWQSVQTNAHVPEMHKMRNTEIMSTHMQMTVHHSLPDQDKLVYVFRPLSLGRIASRMTKSELRRVPATSALLAFESAARHSSFSEAAKELEVTQPAVSRQIARLEKQLGRLLFERFVDGVALTDDGQRFLDAVSTGLRLIQEASVEAVASPPAEQVVIACSHDASQLFLLPRFSRLQAELGEHVTVRVFTYHPGSGHLPRHPITDMILNWEATIDAEDYRVIHEEAVLPVCSPQYADDHKATLRQAVARWGDLVFLDLAHPKQGWATWDDWFHLVGKPETVPRMRVFDSYSYVLDAAANSQGIAMGWKHYVEPFLQSGELVKLADDYTRFENRFCGALTPRGRNRPVARACLSLLSEFA